jgi:hypothetical protein
MADALSKAAEIDVNPDGSLATGLNGLNDGS